MVANGVNGVINYCALVVLLGFFELFSRRLPCLVDHVKNFHGLRVGLITGL